MAGEMKFDAIEAKLRDGKAAKGKSRAERGATYRELVGFMAPRVEARLAVTGALDRELLDMQETMRAHAMNPACFDTKTAQMMIFGMLVFDQKDAARLHGRAARKAGATWEELHAVVGLAYIFGGVLAANFGAEVIAGIVQAELDAEAKG